MAADWVIGSDKKDKSKAELEEFSRNCSTKYKYYDGLYKKHYTGLVLNVDKVVEVYSGCMPHYEAILRMEKPSGERYWRYGNIDREDLVYKHILDKTEKV